MVRWQVTVWLWVCIAACDYPMEIVTCANGTLCPSHLSCPTTPGDACFDPNVEPMFCVDQPAGTLCTARTGEDGTCNNADECIPTTCGDGIVEGREICDGGAGPATCVERGFDYGRTACANDCAGTVEVTCGYLGWHDLELGLEQRFVNDVTITGDVVWAAGYGGVYRYEAGTWTSVYGPPPQAGINPIPWSFITGTSSSDIWVVALLTVAHWDGSTWTSEPFNGLPTFAELSDGAVVIGAQVFDPPRSMIQRRVNNAWQEEIIDASGTTWTTAFSNLSGVEVVASSYLNVDAFSGTVSYGSIFFEKPSGTAWQAMTVPPLGGGYVVSIAGSADDFIVTAQAYDQQNVEYYPPGRRYVRTQNGTTVTTIAGSGRIAAAGDQYLVLDPDGSGAGTTYGPRGERRVVVPGPVRLATSAGDRVVVAVDGTVYELGGALWSAPLAVTSDPNPSLPDVTRVAVRDFSTSSTGISIIDKQRSVTWSMTAPYGLAPAATELTRAHPDLVGIWGSGTTQLAFDSAQITELVGGAITPLANGTPRDIAGNSVADVMIVGEGSEFARQFNGATWAATTGGSLAAPSFRAVIGTGSGTYLAVGDDGLIARFASGGWSSVASGTSIDLRAISAIDATTFTVVGDRVALRCTSSGCAQDTIPNRATDVAMIAPDDIFVVGDDGSLHFDGVGWSPIDLRALEPTRIAASGDAVWFADHNPTGGLERLIRMRSWNAP